MAEERVIKIGMLGLGTVGTGVYKVLKSQQEEMLPKLGARVELKKILVRNVEKAAAKVDDPSIVTMNFEDIANDPEIEIVVEVMGGKQPAMNYILACLDAGKNVVTKTWWHLRVKKSLRQQRETERIFSTRHPWREEFRLSVR